MSCQFASADNFFVVRWGSPSRSDFERVIAEVERLRAKVGKPLFYVGIMPEDMGRIDDEARNGFMKLTESVLPHCERLCVAFEAKGFRGAIMRSAMTAMVLMSRQWKNLVFVDSVEAALEQGRSLWLGDRGAMVAAIEAAGAPRPKNLN